MINKFFSKFKFVLFPVLVLNFSLPAFASEAPFNSIKQPAISTQIKQTFNTAQKRQEFNFITQECTDLNLPKALAVIPIIESAYNPQEVSNVGAAGLWQLMVPTAKQYGISGQQRFSFKPSTNAALKYFNDLHKEFGSWQLAVAAYNAGQGTVEHALKENPGVTSVQQLKLPTQTKQYVQKFDQLRSQLGNISSYCS
jgi:membrane-bound lytic murein transglycosylase D